MVSRPLDPSSLSPAETTKLVQELSSRVEQLESESAALRQQLATRDESDHSATSGPDHFRTIVDSEPACVKLVGRDGTLLWMNPAGVAMTEAETEADVIGLSVYDLIVEEDIEPFKALNERVFAGESVNLEFAIIGMRGTHRQMETFAAPLRDNNGKVVAQLGITHDITARKRDQEELLNYRDHLEELVSQRTDELERTREAARRGERRASVGTLAAGLAHELNNPLGTMLLGAELAIESANDPGTKATLRAICEDVRRCSRIVTSMLQFSRQVSSDKLLLSLNTSVQLAQDRTRKSATRQDVEVQFELASDVPHILGNETELERVLINIIENAVFASSAGTTVVVATRTNGSQVECRIVDQGHGMSTDQAQQAFDPFFTTGSESGGTGLGLSIAHGIVGEHDGTIEIDSVEGRGTTVTLSFPTAAE